MNTHTNDYITRLIGLFIVLFSIAAGVTACVYHKPDAAAAFLVIAAVYVIFAFIFRRTED